MANPSRKRDIRLPVGPYTIESVARPQAFIVPEELREISGTIVVDEFPFKACATPTPWSN